jgi:hypothetical protein
VPLLYLSAKLLPDVHPTMSGLTPEMYPTLCVWMAGITLFSAGTMAARCSLGGSTLHLWERGTHGPLSPPTPGLL